MRSAPPVLVPVGRFVWGGRLVGLLATLTALAGVLAGWQFGVTVWRAIFMGCVWLLAVTGACWISTRETLPPGELSWDGQSWWYRPSGGAVFEVTVSLQWDAGRALLLQLNGRPLGRWPRHAWLQAAQMPEQWHGLRCAVHAGDTL